jgi:hypothetical protein
VADYCDDRLGVVRVRDRLVVEEIDLGTSSDHIAVHPSGGFVYVTCPGVNGIKVIGFGSVEMGPLASE